MSTPDTPVGGDRDAVAEALPQMDRLFVGLGEYVRADEAVRQVMDLQRKWYAAESRVKELEAALAWRPIESAPKDGTAVDLGNSAGLCIRNARWLRGSEVDPKRCGPGGIWEHLAMDGWRRPQDQNGCGCLDETALCYWRPIPPAPEVPRA